MFVTDPTYVGIKVLANAVVDMSASIAIGATGAGHTGAPLYLAFSLGSWTTTTGALGAVSFFTDSTSEKILPSGWVDNSFGSKIGNGLVLTSSLRSIAVSAGLSYGMWLSGQGGTVDWTIGGCHLTFFNATGF